MISLLEVAERTQKGPKMEEKSWNLNLFTKLSALARKHDIRYPGDGSWFSTDESLVERVWQAALECLSDNGAYCVSTGRVVHFDRTEIEQAVNEIPAVVVVGEGRDQRRLTQGGLDGQGPLNWIPGHHAPFTEDVAPQAITSFAQIGDPCMIEGFNSPAVDGREIHGLPLEAYAARREVAIMREGVRKAGRPGMAVVLYPVSTRAASLISPIDPVSGLRPTDGVLLSTLPDTKIEHDLLTAALVYEEYGCVKLNGGGAAAIGGFCGGLEGAIIESVVKPLVSWLVYRDSILLWAGIDFLASTLSRTISSRPERPWATSLVCHVLNRKTNFVYFGGESVSGTGGSSGPGTDTFLWQVAMGAIGVPINGGHLTAPRQHRAVMNASQTPLDARFALEVAQAVRRSGFTRQNAGHLLEHVANKLEGRTSAPGLPMSECWDLIRQRPSSSYYGIYQRVKDELSRVGLSFQ